MKINLNIPDWLDEFELRSSREEGFTTMRLRHNVAGKVFQVNRIVSNTITEGFIHPEYVIEMELVHAVEDLQLLSKLEKEK